MIEERQRILRKKIMVARMVGICIFMLLVSLGGTQLSWGEEILPAFGQGEIQVILYADYFCPPCRSMEPDVEPILKDLIKTGKITLTFVDTPTSRFTSLYARYFVYALNVNREFEEALKARNALFEAAEKKIQEKAKLEELLKEKGVPWKPVDVTPAFNFWNKYLKDDNVRSTPSCVVKRGENKEIKVGSLEILKLLEGLKKEIATEGNPAPQILKKNTPEGEKAHRNEK